MKVIFDNKGQVLSISISAAPKFAEGSRVAAEFDKNAWYLGTVLKATPTGYKIAFDDGDTQIMKSADTRIVAVDKKAKVKKALTLAEVKAMKGTAAKPAAAKPAAAKPAAAKKPVKKAVAKPAPIDSSEDDTIAKEAALLSKWSRGKPISNYSYIPDMYQCGKYMTKIPLASIKGMEKQGYLTRISDNSFTISRIAKKQQ